MNAAVIAPQGGDKDKGRGAVPPFSACGESAGARGCSPARAVRARRPVSPAHIAGAGGRARPGLQSWAARSRRPAKPYPRGWAPPVDASLCESVRPVLTETIPRVEMVSPWIAGGNAVEPGGIERFSPSP